MYWKLSVASHWKAGCPGFSVKYGVPVAAVAPLMGGSSVRYRPGLFIEPPPMVTAYRSLSNQKRLYIIQPRKAVLLRPFVQLSPPTPPPYSHPAWSVIENAALDIPLPFSLLSYHLYSTLSSV